MSNLISVGTILTNFFLAIGCTWIVYEIVRWVMELSTSLQLNGLFMGFFRAGLGLAVFCIVYWAIAPLLDIVIPNSNVGDTAFTVITIVVGGILAGLAASFVLFRWIRNGIVRLFKSFPGSDKMKLFIVAIVILIIAILVFM